MKKETKARIGLLAGIVFAGAFIAIGEFLGAKAVGYTLLALICGLFGGIIAIDKAEKD